MVPAALAANSSSKKIKLPLAVAAATTPKHSMTLPASLPEFAGDPAQLYLLAALLTRDGALSHHERALLKECILRRDPRLTSIMRGFANHAADEAFVEQVRALVESEALALHSDVFDECPLEVAKALSKRERTSKSLDGEKSLIYGEVEFGYFARVLRKINPRRGGVFYDLGSGSGRALVIARLLHDFEVCKGIEVLENLHGAARMICKRFEVLASDVLDATTSKKIEVQRASILDVDWSDGDVVFANSTCFEDGLMAQMARQAARLRPGAYFVTFTKGLGSDAFEVLERKRYRMSWGPATVFIHLRKNLDGTPFEAPPLTTIADDASYQSDEDGGSTPPSSPGSPYDDDEEVDFETDDHTSVGDDDEFDHLQDLAAARK